MRKYGIIAAFLLLTSNVAFAGVLNDADIKPLADTVAKSYSSNICKNDLPGASAETCECLGKGIATHLQEADSVTKLKACQKEGYDDCVSTQIAAAKSALTENEINACKTLTKDATPAAATKSDAPAAATSTEKTTPAADSTDKSSSTGSTDTKASPDSDDTTPADETK
jgi:hypothetical protein